MLIGARVFELPCPRGMTFYGLQSAVRKLNQAIDELEASRRHKNQIDIEEAIARAPA